MDTSLYDRYKGPETIRLFGYGYIAFVQPIDPDQQYWNVIITDGDIPYLREVDTMYIPNRPNFERVIFRRMEQLQICAEALDSSGRNR